MALQNSEAMISMDMPAGPSEVLVIADASARPSHVAADLLSQAEHGPDSQVMHHLFISSQLLLVLNLDDAKKGFMWEQEVFLSGACNGHLSKPFVSLHHHCPVVEGPGLLSAQCGSVLIALCNKCGQCNRVL